MADVVLRAESLSKSYVDGGVRAVDGIELTVRAGEFVNIMGSSGSGKTTLLYLLAGLERPSDGSVWVEQNRIDQLVQRNWRSCEGTRSALCFNR